MGLTDKGYIRRTYDDILNDKEIGVVAEAIGGLEPAHTFVVKALKAGKHVYSAVPCAISVEDIKEIKGDIEFRNLSFAYPERYDTT